MSKAALHIKDLNVEYILKKGSHPAVKNISFQVDQGEIFGLVGESGSGKSTVVQALIRTLPPPAVITGGEVIIDKIDVLSLSAIEVKKYRWKQISIVMQSALNALNPVMTVEDQIKDVLEIHKNITGIKADEKVEQLLRLVDVSKENAKSYPHQLSGGMRQENCNCNSFSSNPSFNNNGRTNNSIGCDCRKRNPLKNNSTSKRIRFYNIIYHSRPKPPSRVCG